MKNIIIAIFALFLVAGCSMFNKESEQSKFTIGSPINDINSTNMQIKVLPFTSLYPARTEMMFCNGENSFVYDNTNTWLNTPQTMVTEYFELYFNNPLKKSSKNFEYKLGIKGRIITFACNLLNKEVTLTLLINIYNTNDDTLVYSTIYTSKVTISNLSASEYSIAISKAINAIAFSLQQKLLTL